MRWLMLGCSLGALGALARLWQSPYATWVSMCGVAALLLGLLRWLSSLVFRSGGHDSGNADMSCGSDADFGCGSFGGDCGDFGGGSDGGCGGD